MGKQTLRLKKKSDFISEKNTSCPVCNRPMKLSQNLNYGGRVCVACRVFFRRFCRSKTWCPIFLKVLLILLSFYFSRSAIQCQEGYAFGFFQNNAIRSYEKCKVCRYMLCLKCGMNPDRVQKKKFHYQSKFAANINDKTPLIC